MSTEECTPEPGDQPPSQSHADRTFLQGSIDDRILGGTQEATGGGGPEIVRDIEGAMQTKLRVAHTERRITVVAKSTTARRGPKFCTIQNLSRGGGAWGLSLPRL
jgi:hypothetical protein